MPEKRSPGNKPVPDWLDAELRRISNLDGDPLLQGVHGIARRFAAEGDGVQQAEWLRTLINVASKLGRFDYELRGFGELRGLYNGSERFAYLLPDLLWYSKWMVERMPEHADASAESIERVFADMEAFYRGAGESLRPVYSLRLAAIYMGQSEQADALYNRWQSEPAGKSDDCPACEADRQIVHLLERDRYEEIFDLAADLISGQVYCDDTPATYCRLLMPALTSGRADLAAWLQRASVRYVRRTASMLAHLSSQIVYLTMVGRFEESERLARIALARAALSANDFAKSAVYRACALSFATSCLYGRRTIGLPRSMLATEQNAGRVALADASDTCFRLAREIGERLDARNQTTRYVDRVDGVERSVRDMVKRSQEPDDDESSPPG